jgi:hypothetical protein
MKRHAKRGKKKLDESIQTFRNQIELAKGIVTETKENDTITDLTITLDLIPLGFARTPAIIRIRFTDEQKAFMIKLFKQGETSGNKFTPQKAAELMAQETDALEPSQIQGFWSRYKKKTQKQTEQKQNPSEPQMETTQILSNPSTLSESSDDRIQDVSSNSKTNSTNRKKCKPRVCRNCGVAKKGHHKLCPKPKKRK